MSTLQTQLLVSFRVKENSFGIILHAFTLTDYSTEKKIWMKWSTLEYSCKQAITRQEMYHIGQ